RRGALGVERLDQLPPDAKLAREARLQGAPSLDLLRDAVERAALEHRAEGGVEVAVDDVGGARAVLGERGEEELEGRAVVHLEVVMGARWGDELLDEVDAEAL